MTGIEKFVLTELSYKFKEKREYDIFDLDVAAVQKNGHQFDTDVFQVILVHSVSFPGLRELRLPSDSLCSVKQSHHFE